MSEDLESVSRQMTIVVLGSPSSGKSNIIRQFTECTYSDTHHPTKHRKAHYTSVGLNERVYQLAILDLPAAPVVPTRRTHATTTTAGATKVTIPMPEQDWESLRDTADAYILVFDLTSDDSFGLIRRLHDQLEGSNGNGNANGSGGGSHASGGANVPLVVMGNKYDLLFATRGHLSRRYLDMVNVIRKQWKWHYIDASAKHNWQIQQAFKTLTKLMDAQYYKGGGGGGAGTAGFAGVVGTRSERLWPGVLRRNRCVIC